MDNFLADVSSTIITMSDPVLCQPDLERKWFLLRRARICQIILCYCWYCWWNRRYACTTRQRCQARQYDCTKVRLYQSTTVEKLIVRADRGLAMSIKRRILVGPLSAKAQKGTRPRPDMRRYALKAGTVWKPH